MQPRKKIAQKIRRRKYYEVKTILIMTLQPLLCTLCNTEVLNKADDKFEFVSCSICSDSFHFSCLKLPRKLKKIIHSYSWQCNDCKCCEICKMDTLERKLLCCDGCDRSYHTFCLEPKLDKLPTGEWFCSQCMACSKDIKPLYDKSSSRSSFRMSKRSPLNNDINSGMITISNSSPLSSRNRNAWSLNEETSLTCTRSKRKSSQIYFSTSPKKKLTLLNNNTGKDDDEKMSLKVEKGLKRSASGCTKLHRDQMKAEITGKKSEENKELNNCEPFRRRSQRKTISISNQITQTHTLKVNVSSLPWKNNKQSPKKLAKPETMTPVTQTPVSTASYKLMFSSEEEEKLKKLVTENDFEMFMNARKATEILDKMKPTFTSTSCNVRKIEFGKFNIDAWYSSPYPQEYFHLPKVYICEFCLKYMKSLTISRRHMAKCSRRYPPGDEIYRKGNISFFEVDGIKEKTYCQNLCLLAKLFLDHKTLYYDVEPFLFYILTQRDNTGCHIVGYFSKEKKSRFNYNVSCILCLPPYMRQGFGKMLIAFSYLLSRNEGKPGSPEKPLSDLGLITYRSYWTDIILGFLKSIKDDAVSIKDISILTGINSADLISTLQYMGVLKYWKGCHIVLKSEDLFNEYETKMKNRPPDHRTVDPNCLQWTPPNKRDETS
ncbi:histone acetyltransferase KAT7-like isoform X2 [Xenia sp. Carnegie-2017]|uniref:histone acetyltransferase KAT7-like isoform X2 n=1 Tax=Xenia sp. Carnegie-2017 TaxID=2897299 RepID=UPI001F042A04|nr:histone acetyltransferase KAT7-like isoform X2 [Xenia sp. Carnegie-2017]